MAPPDHRTKRVLKNLPRFGINNCCRMLFGHINNFWIAMFIERAAIGIPTNLKCNVSRLADDLFSFGLFGTGFEDFVVHNFTIISGAATWILASLMTVSCLWILRFLFPQV